MAFNGLKHRVAAIKVGMSLLAEGAIGKSAGRGLMSVLQRILQPVWGEPPKRDTVDWLRMFGKSPRLNAVHKIAQDVAAAEWGIFIEKGKNKRQIDEHPLIKLLKDPNPLPEFTGYMLMYLTEIYLLLVGEAFWLIERNGLGVPTELWIVPPHWVIETPSTLRPFFTVQPMGRSASAPIYVMPDDIVYFKEPNPLDPYGRGLGRAHAVYDEVETDEYMSKYAKNFFFNDAKPPIVMQAPGADQAQRERLQEDWMQKYAGWKKAHTPAILSWDAKIQELGKSQKEMDFVESRKFLRDAVNQHFQMPPELMGIIENSNRATIDAADFLYKENVLSARLQMIQDTINVQLVPYFDKTIRYEYMNVVTEDKAFTLKVANDGLQRGTIKVNEWRKANGFDPDPGGDVFLFPKGYVAVSSHAMAQPPEQAAPESNPNTNDPPKEE